MLLDLLFLAALGSDDYATREAATTCLQCRGRAAVPALRLGRVSPDPEVRFRCRESWGRLAGGMVADLGPLPMIDAAWYDPVGRHYDPEFSPEYARAHARFYPFLQRVIAEHPEPHPEPDHWWHYYKATELAVRQILADDDPDEVAAMPAMLREMHHRDSVWYGGADKVPEKRRPKR